MATLLDVHDVLTYIAADLDFVVTEEKRAVWHDQFKDQPREILMEAARFLVARKVFGRNPRVADMWEAIANLTQPDTQEWAEAWTRWESVFRRYGRYETAAALSVLGGEYPIAKTILEHRAREYADMTPEGMGTFRAQFRQQYEARITSKRNEATRPAGSMTQQQIASERHNASKSKFVLTDIAKLTKEMP